MLHYFAKNMFAKVLVSPVKTDDGSLNVFVVSESDETLENATITISVQRFDSFVPSYQDELRIEG